jgi:dTDP-D-glucose 4,6-dehydratase
MNKHLLLTGGAGFIGSHTVEHVLKNTDWNITILDRLTYAGNLNRLVDIDCWEREKGRVKFIFHDFRAPVNRAIAHGIQAIFGTVDYLIHMGAESHVDRSIDDPLPFAESNVIGTVNILNYARYEEIPKIIYVSTDEVYGPSINGHLHVEGEAHRPGNPYSASKAAAEDFCLAYANTYGLPVIITNCFSMDTKLFTPHGFKGYDEINVGDYVWTTNDENKFIKTQVLEKIKMPGPKQMIHFKANRVDQLVTPNHRMMVKIPHGKPRRYGDIEEIHASNLVGQPRFEIPLTGEWEGTKADVGDFYLAKIFGWYISEGYMAGDHCVCFGAGTDKQQKYLLTLLQEGGFENQPYINGRSVRIHSKRLAEIVRVCGKGAENKKIPDIVRSWSKELLRQFLDAAVQGDGSFYGNGMVYYTKSETLAWQMCEVSIKAGYSALLKERFTQNPTKTKIGKSFIVRISDQNGTLEKKNVSIENYSGDVWCVRTSTGRVFPVRNGAISLSGQTMNNFGERQDIEKFVPKTLRAILRGEPVVIHVKKGKDVGKIFTNQSKFTVHVKDNKGQEILDISSRCWLHARNHADALLFLLRRELFQPGERYNVTGIQQSVDKIARMIANFTGLISTEPNYVYEDFHSFRPGHDMHYGLNGNKLRALGWEPPFSLEDSLRKTVRWYIDHPTWLNL